jgi:glycosyltransferase involved in cell wall biosynthesis
VHAPSSITAAKLGRPLRIAQVAPLDESVPPRLYGGTERVVSYLTEELVRLGHAVTLFASGDSRTAARLEPMCERAIRLDRRMCAGIALHVLMMERVFARATDFDVIHLHTDSLALPLARRYVTPCLLTLHGRLDMVGLRELFHEFGEMPLASISNAQRAAIPHANWIANVPHGVPLDQYPFVARPRRYLAFLGRISPEKRVDQAIEIAQRAGMPLKIAAKVDPRDTEYFAREIEPLLSRPGVEFIGEIGDTEKGEFLGNAAAMLFPIDWPEPFGLVMIEAMACGTPVIAYRRGSVPEVIDDGVTGLIVEGVEQAAAAVDAALQLDRRKCRATAERRFSATRMAHDYCDIYRLLGEARCQLRA